MFIRYIKGLVLAESLAGLIVLILLGPISCSSQSIEDVTIEKITPTATQFFVED